MRWRAAEHEKQLAIFGIAVLPIFSYLLHYLIITLTPRFMTLTDASLGSLCMSRVPLTSQEGELFILCIEPLPEFPGPRPLHVVCMT